LEGGGLWEMIRSWESPWMQLVSIRKNFQKTPLPILPWEVIARGLHLQTRNQHLPLSKSAHTVILDLLALRTVIYFICL
jgi:hypothetical protein